MHLCANLSMLWTDRPLAARVAAAAEVGFAAVEVQFPGDDDVAGLRAAARAAGIAIELINVPRGGGDEVGLAALPGREPDFAAAVARCAAQAGALGVPKVNVLAGRPPPGADPRDCAATLARNLRHAADRFAALGVRVKVEPVNAVDVPGFFLTGLDAGLAALSRAEHPNLALQFDLYHMAITEPDLSAAIRRAGTAIGHVQFADVPGRREPGTGGTDFAAAIAALRAAGYDGAVSAEYHPAGATGAGLGWMPRFEALIA